MDQETGKGQGDVKERIQVFLGEFRIMVPALAALFGFQLTTAFHDSFAKLTRLDQAVNFVGVACTAAAILFLLVPASYHRFVREQEETDEFLAFARRSIHLGFVAMPLGIAAAMYLQGLRSFHSHAAAWVTAVAVLGAFAAGWWVLPRTRAVERGMAQGQEGGRGQRPLDAYGLRERPGRPSRRGRRRHREAAPETQPALASAEARRGRR